MFSWLFPACGQSIVAPVDNSSASAKILLDPSENRTLDCLRDLIRIGGGGTWPPTARYRDAWPLPLRAYDYVFRKMEASIPVENPSLDHTRNREIIESFRARMRSELAHQVDITEVHSVLEIWQNDNGCVAQSAWLGYFACVSFLRHSYRWGVVPIVSAAQNETFVTFPDELEVAWASLLKHFGTTSPSGCMTSILYCNMHSDDHLEYSVTVGMPDVHRLTEFWNTKLVVDMEEKVLPMYHLFARAIMCCDSEDADAACDALRSANHILRMALKYFFTIMMDSKMSHTFWMAYVQGFQGWALGGIDGISGGQSLIFRTLDSFLGIRPWPTAEKESLHIPEVQRNWLNSLRDYDIRAVAKEKGHDAVTIQLDALVKQLRLWRMGHMRRMQPYESVYRPERLHMTAGISVVNASSEDSMIEHLKQGLSLRLEQTV
ncbi:hypothetical protein B0H10DRAFT_1778920 [Mycena sp. CBHHK59/15]|nr:hypothetical protein B0H10DRAFT_42543 [Mycena sp. CBHHK59/15]KAJ6627781.1 hypothetical protein B0H10DRAFT_1778920 [Mycena sp. CBHHK59/15]